MKTIFLLLHTTITLISKIHLEKKNLKYLHVSYERIEIDEVLNMSSLKRKERTERINPPTNLKELLDITSDTDDSNYPIFRTPRKNDPSELQTIATGKIYAKLSFNLILSFILFKHYLI